jgi:hypothetical protein
MRIQAVTQFLFLNILLIHTASPIREYPGESRFIIHFTNYVDIAIWYHISEDVRNSLDWLLKTHLSLHSLDCEDEGIHVLVQSEPYVI